MYSLLHCILIVARGFPAHVYTKYLSSQLSEINLTSTTCDQPQLSKRSLRPYECRISQKSLHQTDPHHHYPRSLHGCDQLCADRANSTTESWSGIVPISSSMPAGMSALSVAGWLIAFNHVFTVDSVTPYSAAKSVTLTPEPFSDINLCLGFTHMWQSQVENEHYSTLSGLIQ